MNKITAASFGLAALFALSGCDTANLQTKTISGKAIDPYLAGATVCLGEDEQHCLSDEANVTTDANGTYTLTVSGTHFSEGHTIIVTGGRDIETDANFTGSVVAYHYDGNATVNVSPLTTFAYARFKEANATTHQARQAIEANLTTLFDSDVHADVVVEAKDHNHTAGLKASLKLARSAELFDANGTFGFYVYAARQNQEDREDLDALLRAAAAQAQADANATGLHDAVDDLIDTLNDTHGTVHAIAQQAHDTAHDAARHVHNIVHEHVCGFTGTCGTDQNSTSGRGSVSDDNNASGHGGGSGSDNNTSGHGRGSDHNQTRF